MLAREWQFDGLVGPSHNYAGLATGNHASATNAGAISNPRAAALQGLEKMRFVHNLGVPQAFFPPHYRPHLRQLRALGFSGSNAAIVEAAYQQAPHLLATIYSASAMWAANAATITPSEDSLDGKLHLTPANLLSHLHRHIEADFSYHLLTKIFHNPLFFNVHNYLAPTLNLSDEGAANHIRLKHNNLKNGFNIFVYGFGDNCLDKPKNYHPRQSRLASETIARTHGVSPHQTLYLQQAPEAIDQGVFHNDVIAMSVGENLIVHEQAFTEIDRQMLKKWLSNHSALCMSEISANELPLAEAIKTYLFNSELLEIPGRKKVIILPFECKNHAGVEKVIHRLKHEGMLDQEYYLDVRESMRNGGGPACLRLRIIMTPEQEANIHPGIVFTPERDRQLVAWVERHYRDRLALTDLRDPNLIEELDRAYCDLETIIGMPGLYDPWRMVD